MPKFELPQLTPEQVHAREMADSIFRAVGLPTLHEKVQQILQLARSANERADRKDALVCELLEIQDRFNRQPAVTRMLRALSGSLGREKSNALNRHLGI